MALLRCRVRIFKRLKLLGLAGGATDYFYSQSWRLRCGCGIFKLHRTPARSLPTTSQISTRQGEASAITASDGSYSFQGLAAGDYVVCEAPVSGWRAMTSASYSIHLADGQTVDGRNFGQTNAARISGTVFRDTNRNGKLDGKESGLAGWKVYVDANNNSKRDPGELTATTDALGKYSFVLASGEYVIREVVANGLKPTTAVDAITLVGGQIVDGNNFGNR
jgi:hypothetical protein